MFANGAKASRFLRPWPPTPMTAKLSISFGFEAVAGRTLVPNQTPQPMEAVVFRKSRRFARCGNWYVLLN